MDNTEQIVNDTMTSALSIAKLKVTGKVLVVATGRGKFLATFKSKEVTFSFSLHLYSDGADMLRIRIAVNEAVLENFSSLKEVE